jgi:hypothetical protein
VKGVKLAAFIVLGICTSTPFAFVVGMAWGAWRTYEPPAEIRIRYVERVKPTSSMAPTPPKVELSTR